MYAHLIMSFYIVQFPFVIRRFHSDNGSEFVNRIVAKLLNKLLVHFTKSRPRHTGDNGLVETKNGSVVRKNLGYAYIPLFRKRAPDCSTGITIAA